MSARVFDIPIRYAAIAVLGLPLILGGCIPALVVGGAATGAVVANDRRAAEVVLGDERVELMAINRLSQAFGDRGHINVTSYNYSVLLSGEVPDDKSREQAERIAAQVERVRSVVNEIQVAGSTTMGSRANDTYLTGRVKAAYVAAQRFSPNHVKLVTEAGVVYLMGLVTRQEADDATELTRDISGVRKVVRVFEYVVPAAQAK